MKTVGCSYRLSVSATFQKSFNVKILAILGKCSVFHQLWGTKFQNQSIITTLKFPTLNLDRGRLIHLYLILRVNFFKFSAFES